MVTRFRVGTNHPLEHLYLHVSSVSPLPKSYRDAFNDPNWQNAMCDEYHALIKNNTWTLLKGVDVDETFSPMVKSGTIRTVLSLATSRHWLVHQLDVKNAFLHGDLSETVYMHQPLSFRDSTHPDYGTDIAYLSLYVDDIVLTASSENRTSVDNQSLKLGGDSDSVSDPTLYRSLADLVAYFDADWTGCPTTRRLTSGYFVETCWYATYWLGVAFSDYLPLAGLIVTTSNYHCYYPGNPVQHQRTKHIEIDIHFVRDLIAARQIRVLHVPSRYQFADIFTKGLPSALFEEFCSRLSVRSPPASTAGEC
ncbi:ribonuclease H-like domain-containing protein [Tanacetum coccineum]